jgi:hypothetical protein
MSYTIFNGWNIVPMPTYPAPRQVTFRMCDSVGMTQSPWTMQSQVQQWAGGDWWELDVQLPPLKPQQIGSWTAWLAALRGKANVFQMGDPQRYAPLGLPLGSPSCSSGVGINLPMMTTVTTQGWTPNKSNLLLPGDYLQIGYRLHIVAGTSPVNSDSLGDATFEIWPSLREDARGVSIITSNPKGLFRLADNKREFSENVSRLFGLTFKAIEAR